MKSAAKLKVVDDATDITALIKADINKRDWNSVHIAGDRSQALPFLYQARRGWYR